MRLVAELLRFSATDLANHLGCDHVNRLELAVAEGHARRPHLAAADQLEQSACPQQRGFANSSYSCRRLAMWRDQLARDVRSTFRIFRRAPGSAVVIVLTLALGLGATTAIFSVVNAVLLQPLPYPRFRSPGADRRERAKPRERRACDSHDVNAPGRLRVVAHERDDAVARRRLVSR
jgi:hypothetical protein